MTATPDSAADVAAAGFSDRFAQARSRLGGAQKSKVGVPAYLRFVNRRMGGWLASVGHGFGLTPNHLTAISAGWSAVGIALLCLVTPSVPVDLAVTLSLLAGYAFDSADGQLSRVRGDGTPAGEWLDHVVDMAKTASLHAAVAVSLLRFGDLDARAWLLLPLAFGIINVTYFFAMLLRDQLGGAPPRPAEPAPNSGIGSLRRSLLLVPMDYATLCVVFVLLPAVGLFLAAYALLLAVVTAFAAQSFVKAYRRLAAPVVRSTTLRN